jgi:GPH family glycoside/pentoside/hexuronide:cation symporter
MTQLRIADIVIPALTAGLAILVMWNYELIRRKSQSDKSRTGIEKR